MRYVIALVLFLAACASSEDGEAGKASAVSASRGRDPNMATAAVAGTQPDAQVMAPDVVPADSQVAPKPDSSPVSADTKTAEPDTYVAPVDPPAQWFGPNVPPVKGAVCPPAKPTPLGIGTPCTDGGTECKNGLKCGCGLRLDVNGTVLRNIPCFCVSSKTAGINSPATCDDCGEGAACCKAIDRKNDNAQFLCLPLSCSGLCAL